MVGVICAGKPLKWFSFYEFAVFVNGFSLPTGWWAIAHQPERLEFSAKAPDLSLLRRSEMPRPPRVPFARRIL